MKVLVLTAAYPAPSEPERAAFVENLTRALTEGARPSEPVEATVVAPRVTRGDPLRETRGGIVVRRFRYPGGGRRLKEIERPSPLVVGAYLVSFGIAALSEARRTRPDVILGHWVLPTGPVAALVSRARRVPLALVAHGSDIHRYALSSRIAGRLAGKALGASRLTVASCRRLRGLLVQTLGVAEETVRVLPMGIDERIFGERSRPPPSPAERAELRALRGLDPGAKVLLFVGDIIREKGVVELAKAHEALVGRGLAVDLVVIGSGPLARDLLAPRAAAPGSRIRLVGRVPQEELPSWYRAADILVLPSWGEGSPLVVMEALACGVPVVASSVGGIPDLVEDGLTGRLVPATEERTLADTLEESLHGESLDRFRGALAGRSFDFGAAHRAAELRGLLADILPRGGDARGQGGHRG